MVVGVEGFIETVVSIMFVVSVAVHSFLERELGWGFGRRALMEPGVIFFDILSKGMPLLLGVKLNMIRSC